MRVRVRRDGKKKEAGGSSYILIFFDSYNRMNESMHVCMPACLPA